MSDLVERLSQGSHPVEVSLRPERTPTALREAIDREFVHIKFTATRGGTELGMQLDEEASDWERADFEAGRGELHLEGTLSLDYVPCRLVADIDLSTLEGVGHLVPATEEAASE